MKNILNNSHNDEWMTIGEVVKYSKLSTATIRRYIDRGNLKASKQTGRILVKRSKVDEWLNG
tara:strand:+ start:536 stop:721 length:186 start_codon:yes stop_codon:yes gene_type:complete